MTSPLAHTHPHVAAEWHPDRNQTLTPDQVSAGSCRRVWWVCPQGHPYRATVYRRTSRTPSGCPFCAGRAVLPGFNDLAHTHPALAAQWHPDRNQTLTAEQVSAGSHRRVWWTCPHGHSWDDTVAHRAAGRGCPV